MDAVWTALAYEIENEVMNRYEIGTEKDQSVKEGEKGFLGKNKKWQSNAPNQKQSTIEWAQTPSMEARHALQAMQQGTEESGPLYYAKWEHHYSDRRRLVQCVKKVEDVAERVAETVGMWKTV